MRLHGSHFLTRLKSACPLLCVLLFACGGGGGGGGGTTPPPSGGGNPPPGNVSLSGSLSYDFVPHDPITNGLDYDATQARPIRGAVVELLSATGAVLATAVSGTDGSYTFNVAANSNVSLRVKAQLLQSGTPSWNFSITDNTNDNALYVMESSLINLATNNVSRNLHAASGWGGFGYSATRSAAPFAILDSIYRGMQFIVAADPSISLPAIQLRWSVNNRPVDGDRELGEVSSSSYVTQNGISSIYLLGEADVDTDEYDVHVILHELGHYLEDKFSRSDSVGGPHSITDRLDPRVAFAEGWSDAFSAMASGEPVYRDASGQGQSSGFKFSMESNFGPFPGWYSEGSVYAILYDLYDNENESADTVSLGFVPIFEALKDSSYKNTGAFTTIFSYLTVLAQRQAAHAPAIEGLLQQQDINGDGHYGEGESNSAGLSDAIPVYRTIFAGGAPIELCSALSFGDINKLGNRIYVRFSAPASRNYTVDVQRVSGALQPSDPDVRLWLNGAVVRTANSSDPDREIFSLFLNQNDYLLEVYEWENVNDNETDGGSVCFRLTIT